MMNRTDYEHCRRQVAEAAAAQDRQRRREAAIDRLDDVDAVEYDGEKWLLLEIQPDGRVVLEQWDDMAIVEPTKVRPAD